MPQQLDILLAQEQVLTRIFSDSYFDETLAFLGKYIWKEQQTSDLKKLWDWKYFLSPFGKSSVGLAFMEGSIVGVGAAIPWNLLAKGHVIKCVRWADLVTHPNFRRRHVARGIVLMLMNKEISEGTQLFFNAEWNDTSLSLALKNGWNYVERLYPLIQVINYNRLLRCFVASKLAHYTGESAQYSAEDFFKRKPCDAAMLFNHAGISSLIDKDRKLYDPDRLTTERTLAYMKWRYGDHPSIPYYTIMHERAGELRAAVIFRTGIEPTTGIKEIVIDDVLTATPEDARPVLEELKGIASADYLLTRMTSGSWKRAIFMKSGFRIVKRNVRHLAAQALDKAIPDPSSSENWSVSMGELEAF